MTDPAAGLSVVISDQSRAVAELQDLTDRARGYAQDSRSAATRRAYASDLQCFEGWCTRRGIAPYPLEPAPAALYMTELAETKALATIVRRRTAIAIEHKRRGLNAPPFRHPQVDDVWKGIRRRLGAVPQKAKDALVIEDLRRVVAPLGGRLLEVRDRALMLLGFAGAFRRSEIVGLDLADVRFVTEGVEVTLRRSKTDQEAVGRLIGIPYGSRLETCPVRALRSWLDASAIVDGPMFRPISRHGIIAPSRLTAGAVAIVVKRRASAVQLNPARLAGHSLRAGFATSAALAGVGESLIAQQTGHRSIAVLRRYIRPATIWRSNAASGVGL
jgi:integrase